MESSVFSCVPCRLAHVTRKSKLRLSRGMGLWRNNVKFQLLCKLTLGLLSSETFSQMYVCLYCPQNITVDLTGFFSDMQKARWPCRSKEGPDGGDGSRERAVHRAPNLQWTRWGRLEQTGVTGLWRTKQQGARAYQSSSGWSCLCRLLLLARAPAEDSFAPQHPSQMMDLTRGSHRQQPLSGKNTLVRNQSLCGEEK